jgi:hypothetical protein
MYYKQNKATETYFIAHVYLRTLQNLLNKHLGVEFL